MKSLSSYGVAASMLAIAVLASPATAKEKQSKAIELNPVGEPINCITPSQIRSTQIIDDKTIDFTMTGGTVYRNTMPYGCSGLKSEERFSYKLTTNQLCSVDFITVLLNYGFGMQQGASCGLGKFQKMEKPAK